jgi:hypothetical protein
VFTGSASTRQEVIDWVAAVRAPSRLGSRECSRSAVNTARNNQVSITICWQAPSDHKLRHYTLVTYVN